MLKMPRKMAVLGAMLAALLITGAALAQQTPPHTFYGRDGDVTIDGDKAPSGTTIMATAGGENVGMATVGADGEWSLEVTGGAMGVTFTVNGMAASGSYDAPQGLATKLTLAVTSATEEESDELEDNGGTTGGDDGTMMDGGDDSGDTSDELEGDGDVMDGGDGDSMQNEDGNGDGADDGSAGDGMTVEGLDEDPPTDGMTDGDADDAMGDKDDAMEGDGAMEDGDEEEAMEGDNEFPDTGTGGLADSSRGVSSAVYGGIAGALALIALASGVAVRRRAQS